MKLFKTSWYPLKGFKAITHYPIGVFYRGTYPNWKTINHESIHWAQQIEISLVSAIINFLLIIFFNQWFIANEWRLFLWFTCLLPFYLIYFIEWIFKGYRGISFEKEAYTYQSLPDYPKKYRKLFGQWRK